MDTERLSAFASEFARDLQESDILKNHVAEHIRRSQRAMVMLTQERVPTLTEPELRELFFDSDAFSFWKRKDWEFNNRLQKNGLDGLRHALSQLIACAEKGLTLEDLKQLFGTRGLGTLLTTELLAYRFPDRYWTFSSNVTLPAFEILGEDVKANLPRGQKSEPYLYRALEPAMAQVRQALASTGLTNPDNLVADIFLWWIKTNASTLRARTETHTAIHNVSKEKIEQAMQEFDQQKRNSSDWTGWELDQSNKYAVLNDDKRYPPKEIMRMATGATDFDSSQARAYLKARGFDVIPLRAESEPKGIAWIFQANPRVYDLENGLRHEKINDWQVNRYRQEFHKGQRALFWKAGENRGLYGVGMVVTEPYSRANGDLVVDIEYQGRLKNPILYDKLKEDANLSGMQILRAPQGTNFRVSAEEWAALKPLLGEIIPPDPDAVDARGQDQPVEPISLSRPLESVLSHYFKTLSLHFSTWQIATFYTALQAKGFVILSGISGTGKTKLAQHFAGLLPQPVHAGPTDDEIISLTVRPYMLKYNRMIIPQSATRFFDPPKPGDFQEIMLRFDGKTQTCRLVHAAYQGHDHMSLLLRGRAREWFAGRVSEGEQILLEPELDAEEALTGFKLVTGEEESGEQPISTGHNWLFVSVRPDWRDSKSLLGYYNPLTGTYEWTPFLRFLLNVSQSYRAGDGLAWFAILDEMNLAHVEYYFADLLSVLESGRDENGWSREPIRLVYPEDAEGDLPPAELRLPPNLYIVGTINLDETTYAFSPKVLDRAFTLELTEADFSDYLTQPAEEAGQVDAKESRAVLMNFTFGGHFTGYGYADKMPIAKFLSEHADIRGRLQALNQLLRPYNLHFGFRVLDEIVLFLYAAQHNQLFANLDADDGALDSAVLMKVLPKFHGSRGKLEGPLRMILAWCIDPDAPAEQIIDEALTQAETPDDIEEHLSELSSRYPKTAERARRMLWTLYTDGFATFG